MDKTVIASNLLKGETVSSDSPWAQKIVLITQHFEITDNQPHFFGICTGFVLSSRLILTAAHCLNSDISKMKIILNPDPRKSLNPESDLYNVISSQTHPAFIAVDAGFAKSLQDPKANADLALLFLDRNIRGKNPSLDQMLFLHSDTPEDEIEEMQITITGFGRTTSLKDTTSIPYNEINSILKKAELTVTSSKIQGVYFTLAQKDVAGVCYGDSGAPVFLGKNRTGFPFAMAIGVFQTTEEKEQNGIETSACAGSGIYLNLNPYKKWIMKTAFELTNLD